MKDLQIVGVSAKLSTDGMKKKNTSEQLLVDQTARRGAAQALQTGSFRNTDKRTYFSGYDCLEYTIQPND